MAKHIDLTLEQRYNIIKNIYRIPCTITVRLTIDGFIDKMVLSDAEQEQGYSVDTVDGKIVPSDTTYVRSYAVEELGPVLDAVRDYADYLWEIITQTEGKAESAKEIREVFLPLTKVIDDEKEKEKEQSGEAEQPQEPKAEE